VEGHNGVFDVMMNGKNIYKNSSCCGPLPGIEDVIRGITMRLEPTTDAPKPTTDCS
jgi:hypothetical protein